jgi:chemotaxis protein histidine kinase CheA
VADPKKAGLLRYLKEAFMFRWNLLVFGGAAAAAVVSGHADIAMPLVAAAEITYLAGLTTLPRFQGAIDAKARAEQRGNTGPQAAMDPESQANARDRILEVLKSLTEDRRSRFLRLRARCVEMSRIANAVRGDMADRSGASTELRTPALDRLLWVYLRLLLSDQAISRFVQAADEDSIDKTIADLTVKRKKRADSVGEANQAEDRIIKSLDDSIATAGARKENVEKSKGNAEFISTELDRLENKIQAVTELAVGHTDPNEVSSRIDAISEGISQTEQTIRDLQQITGVSDADTTPSILDTDLTAQPRVVEGAGAGRRSPGS